MSRRFITRRRIRIAPLSPLAGIALVACYGSSDGDETADADVDCRVETRACADGFECTLTEGGVWDCLPAAKSDAGPTGRTDAGASRSDSGVSPPGPGPRPDAAVEPPPMPETRFEWVCITDTSAEENDGGTPGVDICGVSVDCGIGGRSGSSARVDPGSGVVCTGDAREGCGAPRNDRSAALDDGRECVADSDPSDYVSIGVGGRLCVRFDDVLDCEVTVVEYSGSDEESYIVAVCTDVDRTASCIEIGSATESGAFAGVSETFMAPSEPED